LIKNITFIKKINMIDQIKALRVTLDKIITLSKELPPTQHFANAAKHIADGRSLLGTCLGELGQNNPYTPAKNIADIPPPTDKANEDEQGFSLLPTLDKVNLLCDMLQIKIEQLKNLVKTCDLGTINFCLKQAISHLHLAKFQLGYHLKDLRNGKQ
jgi:hypothetical protein